MKSGFFAAALLAVAVPLAVAGRMLPWQAAARWGAVASPKPGPPRAIGSYAAGCLRGAVALPPSGAGYELLHLSRRRNFGHPALIAYVRRLAAAAEEKKLPPLLVGDLSQPRGGPTTSDHGSHQIGLDVDVAYTRPGDRRGQPLDLAERDRFELIAVVDPATLTPTPAWTPAVIDLLELAARDPAVDRVFVSPAVKREVCARDRGAPWLARLRPWWGHHDHFHVRLKCPSGSTECRPQAPVPTDDGCGLPLAWWFTNDARQAGQKRMRPKPPSAGRRASLPRACRDLLR